MNWKYRVDDEDLILSEDEDRQVREMQARGEKGIVILRGGDLRLNLSFVRYVRQTENLTSVQEDKKLEPLALAQGSEKTYAQKRKNLQDFVSVSHNDFYERMGWKHSDTCTCKTC